LYVRSSTSLRFPSFQGGVFLSEYTARALHLADVGSKVVVASLASRESMAEKLGMVGFSA